jgi:phosphoglycolate phosphatase
LAIGVLWGHGDRQELETAGAARIVARPDELRGATGALLEPA